METMPDEGAPVRDARFLLGSIALALFWATGCIAGFYWGWGAGLIGAAISSLVVSYFLGNRE